jgi:hypothetical protein
MSSDQCPDPSVVALAARLHANPVLLRIMQLVEAMAPEDQAYLAELLEAWTRPWEGEG